MPDQNVGPVEHALFGPLSRMGERVAFLEAGHAALKADTEVIRSGLHALAGEVQKVIITEERCLSRLDGVASQMTDLLRAMPGVTTAISSFEGMRDDLRGMINATHEARGSQSRMARLTKTIGYTILWVSMAATFLGWAYDHIRLHLL